MPGIEVAGKTGTAELKTTKRCDPDPENPESCPAEDQKDDPTDTDAWFAETQTQFGKNVVVGNYVYSILLGMSVPDVEALRWTGPTPLFGEVCQRIDAGSLATAAARVAGQRRP